MGMIADCTRWWFGCDSEVRFGEEVVHMREASTVDAVCFCLLTLLQCHKVPDRIQQVLWYTAEAAYAAAPHGQC